jgi:hypothetical protein
MLAPPTWQKGVHGLAMYNSPCRTNAEVGKAGSTYCQRHYLLQVCKGQHCGRIANRRNLLCLLPRDVPCVLACQPQIQLWRCRADVKEWESCWMVPLQISTACVTYLCEYSHGCRHTVCHGVIQQSRCHSRDSGDLHQVGHRLQPHMVRLGHEHEALRDVRLLYPLRIQPACHGSSECCAPPLV